MSIVQNSTLSATPECKQASESPTVMLVTHTATRCGVAQYGISLYRALKQSQHFRFVLASCNSLDECLTMVAAHRPHVMIYNYHMDTLPWLTAEAVTDMRNEQIIQALHHHVISHESSGLVHQQLFDYHIFQDPTFPLVKPFMFSCGRLIPSHSIEPDPPSIFTVGSYGFAHPVKGLHHLIQHVQDTCDEALIRLHVPFNEITDPDGLSMTLPYLAECRRRITKPGISLNVNHEFLEREQVIDFLAHNTINAFFYDAQTNSVERTCGISSTLDWALAARRPIAITRSPLFRHVWDATPSICIEERTIRDIAEDGITPLRPFYEKWGEPQFLATYEQIIARMLEKVPHLGVKR